MPKLKTAWLILCCVLASITARAADADPVPQASSRPLINGKPLLPSDGALEVPDRLSFEMLASRDDVPGAYGVFELKFVIMDAGSDRPRLYFMNSKKHVYHYCFAREILGYSDGSDAFEAVTYFRDRNRKNLAGSIIAHDRVSVPTDDRETAGVYTLEFWPSDPVGFPFVETAYRLIAEAMPFAGDRLLYHPSGETQRILLEEERAAYSNSCVRTISTDQLLGSRQECPLHLGCAYGRLMVAEPGIRLTPRDIVIFRSVPNDLACVAGLITEDPQTPLSHVNLKARQDGIPNAYIRNASTRPEIQPLIGRNVRFELTPDGYTIKPASQVEVDTFQASIRPAKPQVPVRNLSVSAIAALADIGRSAYDAYGSKSANVAELRHIMPGGMAPEGYAVPFSMYDRFMQSNGFYAVAETMMADPAFKTNEVVREDALKKFRRQIRAGTLPPDMMEALGALQHRFAPDTRIRCRSSANVEDLEGFSGAGLYDSKTHKPDEGHLSHTIKQIWAGNWSFRAFEEREFYRIDHLRSAMGVLCHPSYRDESANGVAVTRNLYDSDWRGYYVNVQVGESLVTNPDDGVVPDEFLISELSGQSEYEIQYIRHSNLIPKGSHVLSQTQAVQLADELERVHDHFQRAYGAEGRPDFAMEVEFKFLADGTLVFKQARPWVD